MSYRDKSSSHKKDFVDTNKKLLKIESNVFPYCAISHEN